MAVARASMAEKIIILDDDDEDSPPPSRPADIASPSKRRSIHATPLKATPLKATPLKAKEATPTHITASPFASAKKQGHVLQVENQRLFDEFVAYCSPLTQDCPEVLTFLHTKHSKASPLFLASVEFRNALGRCVTRAQANRAKTFVYINEMCTLLRQHSSKRRQSLVTPAAAAASPAAAAAFPAAAAASCTSTAAAATTSARKRKEDAKVEGRAAEGNGLAGAGPGEELPSTSGLQEEQRGGAEEEKTKGRASRRQIAYLENLLTVYNDEIRRLQEKEMSLSDLEAEDSGYIQEDKLKHKMMKIYNKLCELKGCNNLTGRVIEQRLSYSGTRYPEINKKIERFINSPEARRNPPDYPDIRQQVQRANQRHNLGLSSKQLNQMAQEAFRETGSRMQERRHLDLVYNFGSHLTDRYSATRDPALADPSLLRKLRTNREVALTNLEEVISKYSGRQEDTEEQERSKRLDKEKEKNGEETKQVNGKVEEEEEEEGEEEEEEEDYSEPDIEEEILASERHAGPDENGEGEGVKTIANGNSSVVGSEEEEGEKNAMATQDAVAKERVASGLIPLSDSDVTDLPSNSNAAEVKEEAMVSSNHASVVPVSASKPSRDAADLSPAVANSASLPPSPVATQTNQDSSTATCDLLSANGKSSPLSLRVTRGRKRKREEEATESLIHTIIPDSELDLTLDMGLVLTTLPQQSESTRPDTPTHDLVSSSHSTPPPKKNKVNVATQCDPDEIIVLSDSE
ncbi:Death domain-associated protein 6 [Merluccius polli]|uniref:Death domain-associated protein 6 n=1 Tax=Merluccius polli TaxID=89951 RepID=A0AA47MHE8_MERPO|nr:Death domain-associated protein 6 [Merluccius polli]